MLNLTAAPSSGVPSWNLMPVADVHRPLRVVGVVVDRLDEQRHDLAVVASTANSESVIAVERDVAARRAGSPGTAPRRWRCRPRGRTRACRPSPARRRPWPCGPRTTRVRRGRLGGGGGLGRVGRGLGRGRPARARSWRWCRSLGASVAVGRLDLTGPGRGRRCGGVVVVAARRHRDQRGDGERGEQARAALLRVQVFPPCDRRSPRTPDRRRLRAGPVVAVSPRTWPTRSRS